jgi:hypothetical protein
MKAYCKVDFLFPVGKKLYILDWKTGKADSMKHRKQLTGYGCWASYHFRRDPAGVVSIIAYLRPEYSEIELAIKKRDIKKFADHVRRETEEMYGYCRDVAENIPGPKTEFLLTDNTNVCRHCSYREFCGR